MGSRSGETTTTTRTPPSQITNFFDQFVMPNFGQPGFGTPFIPGNFPIGAGIDPMSQAAQGGLLQFLSGPFQQQFGNLTGAGNQAMSQGFNFFNQGMAGIPGAMQFGMQGLNPNFNPGLGFNTGLSGEASDTLSRILSGSFLRGGGSGGGGLNFSPASSRGGGAPMVNPQEVIDQTTKALTDTFFERTLPGVTSRIIGNAGGAVSTKGEQLAAAAEDDFQNTLARTIADISLGASSENARNATAMAVARTQALGAGAGARASAQSSLQRSGLEAALQAALGINSGLTSNFNPFFMNANSGLFQGNEFLANSGFNLFNSGFGGGQNLLNSPLQGLEMLNAFGTGNRGFDDDIIQRLLPIFMSNNSLGLQDLGAYSGIIGNLFGNSFNQTTTGPGSSRAGGALGGATAGATLGGQFGGPYGAAAGAIVGGLFGAFG